LRCYEKGREEIVGVFGEESALYGSTRMEFTTHGFCLGRVSATSLNYKKMVTAGAELKIL